MKLVYTVLVVFAAYTVAYPNVLEFEINEVEQILSSMKTKEELFEFITEKNANPGKTVKVTNFSGKDCGGPNAMAAINSFVISPDPLQFPGPLDIAAAIQIKQALQSVLKGDVLIEKKLLGKYVKLPCIDNFGSCTYDDFCELLAPVQCPDPIVKIGLGCQCPFKAKTYLLPQTEFTIEASIIPTGDYHIVGNATHKGDVGLCLDIMLTVE